MNIEQRRFLLFKADNGDIYLSCDEWRETRHIHCAIVLDEITAKRIGKMMDESSAAVDAEFNRPQQ
jgi:hypothetical protein